MAAESWESLVARKQAEVAAQIPEAWRLPAELTKGITETSKSNVLDVPRKSGLLSEKQLEITENYDATDLLAMMAKGELTSCEVTQAFCIRAAIAGQVVSSFCAQIRKWKTDGSGADTLYNRNVL